MGYVKYSLAASTYLLVSRMKVNSICSQLMLRLQYLTFTCCFPRGIDKRIPASILLQSPWFRQYGINSVHDACSLMMTYFGSSANILKAVNP